MEFSLDNFSSNYSHARQNIILKTSSTGWVHKEYQHPSSGRDGAPIFLDTFRKGALKATKTLVICSGTHGVEGFCGSAIQSHLASNLTKLPEELAVLIIHAVNPYGFEHIRRMNEDNVDLNRNFVDFSAQLPRNEKYTELFNLLNPSDLANDSISKIMAKIQQVQKSMDTMSFLKAVSGGQYAYSNGTQFGGTSPSWSRKTLETIWETELSHAEIIVQIDIHTGLGGKGNGLLMMEADPEEPHRKITEEWFGAMMVTPRPASNEDVVLSGFLNSGMQKYLNNKWVIPVTLEYGTEPVETVLQVLIEDNWLSQFGDVNTPKGVDIKERLLRAFYPDDNTWKKSVLKRGHNVISQAISGLNTLTLSEKLLSE